MRTAEEIELQPDEKRSMDWGSSGLAFESTSSSKDISATSEIKPPPQPLQPESLATGSAMSCELEGVGGSNSERQEQGSEEVGSEPKLLQTSNLTEPYSIVQAALACGQEIAVHPDSMATLEVETSSSIDPIGPSLPVSCPVASLLAPADTVQRDRHDFAESSTAGMGNASSSKPRRRPCERKKRPKREELLTIPSEALFVPEQAFAPTAKASKMERPPVVRRNKAMELETPMDFDSLVEELKQALEHSKRVVVVIGAGISVAAGIPDFRSSTGIFAQLIEENGARPVEPYPTASPNSLKRSRPGTRKVVTGRDLFDSSVFGNEPIHSMHLRLLADLQTRADRAEPTPVHRLIQRLHQEGKLLRCYTQNIDGLEVGEMKETTAPMTLGVRGVRQRVGQVFPPNTLPGNKTEEQLEGKGGTSGMLANHIRYPTPDASQGSVTEDEASPAPQITTAVETPRKGNQSGLYSEYLATPRATPNAKVDLASWGSGDTPRVLKCKRSRDDFSDAESESSLSSLSGDDLVRPIDLSTMMRKSRIPRPKKVKAKREAHQTRKIGSGRVRFETVYPAVIPLHGQIGPLKCLNCNDHFSLSKDHIESMHRGEAIPCPSCCEFEMTRSLAGTRSRGVGTLRSSVVLYNEEHPDAEQIGEISRRDLCGRGKDRADLLLVIGTSLRIPGTRKLVKEFASVVRGRAIAKQIPESMNEIATDQGAASGTVEDATAKNYFINLELPTCLGPLRQAFDRCILGDAQEVARRLLPALEAGHGR